MKIAIIGASGLLGRALFREFKQNEKFQVVGTAFTSRDENYVHLDLLDKAGIRRFVEQQQPNVIFLVAAEKRPEICEKNPALARAMNVEAAETFAHASKKIGAWLIYISTDYVFDGKGPPYSPEATTNPLNAYGQSKVEGEKVIWRITDDACVLRLPLLYGSIQALDESAVTALGIGMQDKNSAVEIDNWAIRYPTHTSNVARICRQLVEYKIRQPNFRGTFHWSAQELFTKYQMALIMAEFFNFSASNILPLTCQPEEVPRPFDCHLDSTLLENLGMGKRTNFREGIKAVRLDYGCPSAF